MVFSGMLDFLEKLYMVILKVKNMEIKVKDYILVKFLEMSSEVKVIVLFFEWKNEGSCGFVWIEYV